MSFKINDLDKFLTEDYDDEDERTTDIGSEFEKFADAPEEDDEEAIPAEASEVDDAFEMEPEGDGYYITHNSNPVCYVEITCEGNPVDMATLEDPSKCIASISQISDNEKAIVYMQKLDSMGFKTTTATPPKK